MKKNLEVQYAINNSIMHILYAMKIKPSDFIKALRANDNDVSKTIKHFKADNLFYKKQKKDSYCKNREIEAVIFNIIQQLEKTGADIINISDTQYPGLLKQIYFPPPLLFFKGCKISKCNNFIAVVGTRKNTVYGKDAAGYISCELSRAGITVVSGLAAGIDYFAHKAALKHKGGTIGVLGCGINVIYPPENKNLFMEIIENGSIITEFLPGTPPLKNNFPARNRIISGISMGVVVIEAPEKSGALITADFALEQNREVFSIPGSIFSVESNGCHRLIKSGAKLVNDIDDILNEITQFYDQKDKCQKSKSLYENNFKKPGDKASIISNEKVYSRQKNQVFTSPEKKRIYDTIGYMPKSIEDIVSMTGCKTSEVMQALAELEFKNLIFQKSLNQFVRLC